MCMCTAILDMTYSVLDGMLNPTHSLIRSFLVRTVCQVVLLHVTAVQELHSSDGVFGTAWRVGRCAADTRV